jgi:hypothetical protein
MRNVKTGRRKKASADCVVRQSWRSPMETWEQIRDEVHRRFQVWIWQAAPARRYALLVAGYYRIYGSTHFAGQRKNPFYPGRDGLRLVEWVEVSADRPLSPSERADAAALIAAVEEEGRREDIRDTAILRYDRWAVAEHLRFALSDPQRVAACLILYPCANPDDKHGLPLGLPSYSSVRQVMDCLCPVDWDHTAADWKPPHEVVSWARRMYDDRACAALPNLASLLEESGCPDRPLLEHCRRGGGHYRGCAAVDRLLGR